MWDIELGSFGYWEVMWDIELGSFACKTTALPAVLFLCVDVKISSLTVLAYLDHAYSVKTRDERVYMDKNIDV